MHILIPVFFNAPLGGLHENILSTVKYCKKKNYEVTVVCKAGKFEEILKKHKVRVLLTDFTDEGNKLVIQEIKKLNASISKIDIIHSHPFKSRELALQISAELSIPVILTIHGRYTDELHNYIHKLSVVVVVSEGIRDYVLAQIPRYESHKIVVVHNAVNISIYKPKTFNIQRLFKWDNNSKIKISLITRLDKDKEFIIQLFYKALQYTNDNFAGKIEWNVVGDGTLLNEVKMKSERMATSIGGVKFVGWKGEAQLYQQYLNSDIIIGPGRCALEGLSCGKPVIAIGSKGYVGIIDSSRWLKGVYSNFGGLGDKMGIYTEGSIEHDLKLLLENKSLREQLGAFGPIIINQFFDENVVNQKLIDLYYTLKLSNEQDKDLIKETEEKLAIEAFSSSVLDVNKILTLTKMGQQSEEIAEMIMDNKFYLLSSLEVVDFKSGVRWDYLHGNSNNTYQLYLHTLIVISYLCDAYRINSKIEYLEKANEVVLSWFDYNKSDQRKSKLVWSDHAVSDRLINIIYFYSLAIGKIGLDMDAYFNLFESHANFLYEDKNYSKNNHGIMMDRALFMVSLVLESNVNHKVWREKSIYRLREAYYRDFSARGTHLENSPEYHGVVLRLFSSTETILKKFKYTLGEEIQGKMALSNAYYQYIAKPNLTLPMIGDSGAHKLSPLDKKFSNYYDPEAGIAIIQHEDVEVPERSMWLSFVCGFTSNTHKHFDDLSINLYYKGKDFFIDSGKYNYDYNDPIRKYIISPYAHSTIVAEGRNYDLQNKNNIKLTSYFSTRFYDVVRGENCFDTSLKIVRTIYYFKPDILLILDQVESEQEINISQIYNLAPDVEIGKHLANYVELKSGDVSIQITQKEPMEKLEILNGLTHSPRGLISESFRKVTTTNQLQFSKKVANQYILTEIRMGGGIETDFEVTSKGIGEIIVQYKGQTFLLPV